MRLLPVLAFAIASARQYDNPERIWNDPEGCGPAMRRELDEMIADWSQRLEP